MGSSITILFLINNFIAAHIINQLNITVTIQSEATS